MLFISIVLFTILHNMPGGPLAPYMQNPHITQADIERLRHNFGLDRPVYVQYLSWLGAYVRGDWGWSLGTLPGGLEVQPIIGRAFPD